MISTISICNGDLFYAYTVPEKPFRIMFDAEGHATNNPGHSVRTETIKENGRHVLAIGSTEKLALMRAEAILKVRAA